MTHSQGYGQGWGGVATKQCGWSGSTWIPFYGKEEKSTIKSKDKKSICNTENKGKMSLFCKELLHLNKKNVKNSGKRWVWGGGTDEEVTGTHSPLWDTSRGCEGQHRECSQHAVVTAAGVGWVQTAWGSRRKQMLNHCAVHRMDDLCVDFTCI